MPDTPNGTMPEMNTIEQMTRAYEAAMPQEFASTVNLLAHPMAAVAASGALGFGLASHAFGLWMGTLSGAAEASQRLVAALDEAREPVRAAAASKAKLRLVETPAREAAGDVARTAVADAEVTARKVVDVAKKAADDAIADAVAVAAPRKARKAAASAPAKPAGIAKPAAPDDLKAIGGIGPKLGKVLNGLGIWTHGQIAALTEAEIAWLDDHLGFAGRIGRDDWVGQARALSRKK